MLKEFNCDCKASYALPANSKLKINEGEPLNNPEIYRRIVGKMNFLTNTRHDLAFSVQRLSQFMSDPRVPHYEAALHTLCYINNDSSQGLFFNNKHDFNLQAYYDSDWAACPHLRQSVSGFIILLGGSPVSWKSKKQVTIKLSSCIFLELQVKFNAFFVLVVS